MATISELINHLSVIDNRHDHGLINDDEFHGEVGATIKVLVDLLPKSTPKQEPPRGKK